MIAGRNRAVPSKSNFLTCCMNVASDFLPRRLILKKGIMKAAVTAPNGKLMSRSTCTKSAFVSHAFRI
jgi:hypothetical protein